MSGDPRTRAGFDPLRKLQETRAEFSWVFVKEKARIEKLSTVANPELKIVYQAKKDSLYDDAENIFISLKGCSSPVSSHLRNMQ